MTNQIESALKSAIHKLESDGDELGVAADLRSALEALAKCEPLGWYKQHPKLPEGFYETAWHWSTVGDDKRWKPFFTTPQPIEKCEPVAEAIRERDRLGFAVVNVIGKLDEIIENTQEVEVDDFLHIAIPIDKWHELQDALEEMPKRAELYTSPQPNEMFEPVYLIVSGADEIVVTKEKYDSWTSAKRISYTSPISKEWVGLSDEQQTEIINDYISWQGGCNPQRIARLIEAKLKQLNAEKG